MKLQVRPYTILLKNKQPRSGAFLSMTDSSGKSGWGEIAPLPKWSAETLEECLEQVSQLQDEIERIDWKLKTCLDELARLKLLPAVSFGLESALLALLDPLPEHAVPTSALLMGTPEEILAQAKLRYKEGYISAKLKVGNLSFEAAAELIHQLKEQFRLRIDVNRAWSTSDSLHFFSQFPLDAFDYVEEPFQNPQDLAQFSHPLAVDESFPHDLSLEQLELLPNLKALIYKPTLQGGLVNCIPLHQWATKRGISLVLSSSFESDLGLAHIASMAHRLSIATPTGIGTYHHLNDHICALKFCGPVVHIPERIIPAVLSGLGVRPFLCF